MNYFKIFINLQDVDETQRPDEFLFKKIQKSLLLQTSTKIDQIMN